MVLWIWVERRAEVGDGLDLGLKRGPKIGSEPGPFALQPSHHSPLMSSPTILSVSLSDWCLSLKSVGLSQSDRDCWVLVSMDFWFFWILDVLVLMGFDV